MSILQDIRLAFRIFSRAPGSYRNRSAIDRAQRRRDSGSLRRDQIGAASIRCRTRTPKSSCSCAANLPRCRSSPNGDWVFWNDTQELIRRTRTLESVGIYRNAVFDLAGDTNSTPEALYGLKVTADLFPRRSASSPMLRAQYSPGRGSARPCRRDDSELRPMGSPVPFGSRVWWAGPSPSTGTIAW